MNLELSMIPKSGVISTNFEEIKEKLEEEMSTYKTMRVTVDNKKEAKGDMADLRKLKKKLNDRKKEVKEEYMKPYLEVEDGVKQLISIIDGAINFLDGQVAELEEQRVLERKAEITKVYDELVEEELLDYMPLERIWNDKWTKATTTMKSIREEISGFVTKVRTDIATIKAKKIIYLYRIMSKEKDHDATAIAFTTENERTKSKDADTTATKDGTVRTPGTAEVEITASSLLKKGDQFIDELEDALDNDQMMEIWEVNLEEEGTDGNEGKYKSKYFQGFLTELDQTSSAEDNVEISLTFGINGNGVSGYATVSEEQKEIAAYVFRDTQKTGA